MYLKKAFQRSTSDEQENDVIVQNREDFAIIAKIFMEKSGIVFVEGKEIDEVHDENP